MVRKTYGQISDPQAEFEALRPMHAHLIRLKQRVKPLGPEYMILDAVDQTLATAAFHFTRNPAFYSAGPCGPFTGEPEGD
jgi:hypothetical protein